MACCSVLLSIGSPHEYTTIVGYKISDHNWHMACLGIFLLSVHLFFKANRSQVEGIHKLTAGSMHTSGQISNLAINGVITHTSLCSRVHAVSRDEDYVVSAASKNPGSW